MDYPNRTWRLGVDGPMSGRRWTTAEDAIIRTTASIAEARQSLPDRTASTVSTRRSVLRRAGSMPRDPSAKSGRPPQTPDEHRLAQILWQVRQIAQKAAIAVDPGALFAVLRSGDWRDLDTLGAPNFFRSREGVWATDFKPDSEGGAV